MTNVLFRPVENVVRERPGAKYGTKLMDAGHAATINAREAEVLHGIKKIPAVTPGAALTGSSLQPEKRYAWAGVAK